MALDHPRSQIAHLLRRAGFGASEAELDQYAALGFGGTVERLLNPEQVDDSAADQRAAQLAFSNDPTDREARRKLEAAKFGWVTRMLYTQRPLQEKMALFWHTHFATANSKVGNAVLMQQQIQLFREHALGNFETLLQKVTRDPAMLIWLDNRLNRKASPNENFAREVMELFTVGIGNYTEDDIKEAARAFTGHSLTREFAYTFNANQHDTRDKTFFRQTGNFDADHILGILVRHPATARFLTTKLFSWFVHDRPESTTIDRLSSTFTGSGFDIRAVVRDILTGPELLSPQAFHAKIKQPVELVVGSLKALNVQNIGPDATQMMRRMGQDLLNPPDVNGWPGGSTWINATTLFERFNWANRLAMGRDAGKPYFSDIGAQIQAQAIGAPDGLVDYYAGLLVDGDVTPEARSALLNYVNASGPISLADASALDMKARGLVHLTMALPTYQLA
jgi:uncharacterized protein (DUF1800 family)